MQEKFTKSRRISKVEHHIHDKIALEHTENCKISVVFSMVTWFIVY